MTNPIDPTQAFAAWFDSLNSSQRVELAVYLAAALTPAGEDWGGEELAKVVQTYVLDYLREPPPSPIQTLTRLGVVKALVDHLCVPLIRQDLQAHGQAQLAILKLRSLAADDVTGVKLAEAASAQGATYVDRNAQMYCTWNDLAHKSGGALTPEALYEWMYLNTRKLKAEASPFIGNDADHA